MRNTPLFFNRSKCLMKCASKTNEHMLQRQNPLLFVLVRLHSTMKASKRNFDLRGLLDILKIANSNDG